MTRTAARPRRARLVRALAGTLAVGLVAAGLVGAATAPTTTAAYTDRAAAETAGVITTTVGLTPQQTRLAGTATAILDDGTVAVWGFRGNGLSGTGVATVAQGAAISVTTLPSDGHADGARRAVKLAGTSLDNYFATDAGYTGIAALSDDGRVYTWGGTQANNVMGRTNATTPFTQPGQVDIPGTVVDLTSSATVFMALTSDGDLYTWGHAQARGATGQGGTSTSAAVPTKILSGVHSVGAGMWNGWAVRTATGDDAAGVYWWGWANSATGYAGDPSGANQTSNANAPTRSEVLSAYVAGCDTVGVVAGSADDTCSVRSLTGHYYGNQMVLADGSLYTWGNYSEEGTGRPDGTNLEDNTPTLVELAPGVGAVQVGTSEDYVMVLGTDGQVYVYGRYSFSRGPDPATGAMTATNVLAPTALATLGSDVEAVVGFGYSGGVRHADGTTSWWGGTDQGGNENWYQPIRTGFATTTLGTTPAAPITKLDFPGATQEGS
ncbi:hypothetical protein ACH436_15020 [Isoptericola sp. NPDC019693]|uniref:hypothetical protein n=1 Tax=Isoptericola sp. NPDC019693 TaxID=3364009 RepID=UPI00378CAED9